MADGPTIRKIKIALVVDSLVKDQDGVANTYHNLFAHVPEWAEILVITPRVGSEYTFPFRVFQCPAIPIPSYSVYRLAFPTKQLFRELKAFKPDLIHWSSPSLLGYFVRRLAGRMKVPTTTIYHTHFPEHVYQSIRSVPFAKSMVSLLEKPFIGWYRHTSRVLVPSTLIHHYLVERGLPRSQIVRWPRGVDTRTFHPGFRRAVVAADLRHPKTVLFVGRLVRIKGTTLLKKIYDRIKDRYNLVIAGEGPHRKKMESAMPEAFFLGHTTGRRLSELYASSDVFLMPSVTETFGNVVLEAMASGLPVVASAVGGPVDIVQHGITGFLVDPEDVEAFTERIEKICENPELAGRLSRQARAYAETQEWPQLCARFFALLRETALPHGK